MNKTIDRSSLVLTKGICTEAIIGII